MTKMKLQLIITAAISLLIGISVGMVAVHLLTGMVPGSAGPMAAICAPLSSPDSLFRSGHPEDLSQHPKSLPHKARMSSIVRAKASFAAASAGGSYS